jgi:hypothetical protein
VSSLSNISSFSCNHINQRFSDHSQSLVHFPILNTMGCLSLYVPSRLYNLSLISYRVLSFESALREFDL